MDVVIIPPDNRVAVDGVWKTVPVGVAHINAARLNGDHGSIEHLQFGEHWPPPRKLSKDEFLDEFADVLTGWHNAKTDEEIAAEQREQETEGERPAAAKRPSAPPDYLEMVDRAAEAARGRYVTLGAGMAAVYQEKAAEAVAVLAMGREAADALADGGAHEYPVLAASVGVDAPSLYDVAEIVSDKAEAFATAAGAIERVRLVSKQAIRAAASLDEAREIFEAIQWP